MTGPSRSVHAAFFTILFCRNACLSLRHAALPHQPAAQLSLRSTCKPISGSYRQGSVVLAHRAEPRLPLASLGRALGFVAPGLAGPPGRSMRSAALICASPRQAFRSAVICMAAPGPAGKSLGKKKSLPLDKMLQQQGFGTRKDCRKLVKEGFVLIDGEEVTDPSSKVDVYDGFAFEIGDEKFEYREKAYLMLHKPVGYECTTQDGGHHTPVFDLMPWQIQDRGVQCVGRLDVDTTGLLLLTDDGAFSHMLTSPKKQKSKVYIAKCKHAVEDSMIHKLLSGVRLKDTPEEVTKAVGAEQVSEKEIRITITEGKYHQVKRMVAAAGNRVEGLHRDAVGGLRLPDDLHAGDWRYLTPDEVALLMAGEQTE